MNSSLILPNTISITTYPVRIAKCLLGHLLASKTNFCNNLIDQKIRNYILNNSMNLPDGIRIFFWFYPYNCTIIKNDINSISISDFSTQQYSVIKSFPLAFAITFDNKSIENANELIIEDNDNYDTKKIISFNHDIINDWDYPEKMGDIKMHLVPNGNTDIIATPKHSSKTKK